MTEESQDIPEVEFNDNPIRDEAHDCLGYWEQAEPLAELLEQVGAPLVVGIDGGWGQGKTSFMYALESALKQKGHKTLWCEVWKYSETEEVRKALIRTIYDTLRVRARARHWLWGLGGIIGHWVLSWLERRLKSKGISKEIKRLFKIDEIFTDVFEQKFSELVKSYLPRGKTLFVFLDDLDRCFGEAPLQILEAVKLYLSVPRVVFVIGADRTALERAAAKRYLAEGETTGESERPAEGTATPRLPQKYLEKLIQLPFALPAVTDEGLQRLLEGCRVWATAFASIREDWRQQYEELLIERTRKNPRNIKRFFMLHQTNCMINADLDAAKVAKVLALYFWHRRVWAACHLNPAQLYRLQQQVRTGKLEAERLPAELQPAVASDIPEEVAEILQLPSLFEEEKDATDHMTAVSITRAVAKREQLDLDQVIVGLLSKEWEERFEAAIRLPEAGLRGLSAVLPRLAEALNDEQADVRQSGAWAITNIVNNLKEVTPLLTEALKQESEQVRRVVVAGLAKIDEEVKEIVPALTEALKDENDDVRRGAAWALESIGSKDAVAALTQGLKDEDWEVRFQAVLVLGRIAGSEVIEPLTSVIEDGDECEPVRIAARAAIKGIRERGAQEAAWRKISEDKRGTNRKA